MSSSTSEVIRAFEPTVTGDTEYFDLRESDLFLTFTVETAIVVPGALDVARLKDAVARALSSYPLYAGRLVHEGESWKIRLNNAGIPFEHVVSDAPAPTAGETIVQQPFTLAKRIDHRFWESGRETEAVCRITVTQFNRTGDWAFGVSSAHIVGDGFVVYGFLRTVSQLYMMLEPFERPVYDRPPFPKTLLAEGEEVDTPWLDVTYPVGTRQAHHHPETGTPTVRVDFRLTSDQVAQLKKGVLALTNDDPSFARLSAQDALAATLAVVITEAAPDAPAIRTVTTHINFRGVADVAPTSAGNALVQAVAHLPESSASTDIPTLALSIRRSLLSSRDPTTLGKLLVKTSARFAEAARNTHYTDFSSAPGALNINSTRPYNWTSAHFGYPGQARFFHTCSDAPRYVKMFTPNPTRQADGSWRDWAGGAEVMFYIEPRYRGPFIKAFEAKVYALGVQGEVEWMESVEITEVPDNTAWYDIPRTILSKVANSFNYRAQ